MKAWIGIDPGKSGCLCILKENDDVIFIDWPKTNSNLDLYVAVRKSLSGLDIQKTALEKVSSMPGQGVRSMFSFGENNGSWKMLLAVLRLSYLDPTPQAWQKGIVRKSDSANAKHRSYLAASRIFPQHIDKLKGAKGGIKDGRCDALLIAYYVKNKN